MIFSQRGQGLSEYALLLTLIAIVVIVSLALLGSTLGNAFDAIGSELAR